MKSLDNLRKIRRDKKLTRDDLSKLSGVPKITIQALEDGNTNVDNAKISTLIKLASALHTRVRKIVDKETAKRL